MNKKTYLEKLKQELKKRSISNIGDILADYDELIEIKMREGKSEADAIEELGNVEDLADAYGEKRNKTGEKNIYKFMLLQIFNLLVGFAILISFIAVALSFIAVIVGFIVAIVYIVISLFQGDFSTMPALFIMLAMIMGSIFAIGLSEMLIRIIFIGVYDYVILNINTLKENKLSYKRLRIKKLALVTTALSFILMIVFGSTSAILSSGKIVDTFIEVGEKMSYNTNYTEPTEYILGDNIKSLEVNASDVEIVRGNVNKVESNRKLIVEEVDGKAVIKVDNKSAKFMLDFTFDEKPVKITVASELESLIVDSYNVEINDVVAIDNDINGTNVEYNARGFENVANLKISTYNLEYKLNNTKIANMKIDSTNTQGNVDESAINDFECNSYNFEYDYNNAQIENFSNYSTNTEGRFENSTISNLISSSYNLEMNIEHSFINKFNVKDSQNIDVKLESSTIETVYNVEFIGQFKIDSESKVNNINK